MRGILSLSLISKGELMNREKMIQDVLDDMRDWLKRDSSGFWDHVYDLERAHLRKLSDKELAEVHEASSD